MGTGGQCGQTYTTAAAPANLMFVLDHSGSMDSRVSGVKKWDAAKLAVRKITNDNPQINFGLEMFSEKGNDCSAGRILVGVGQDAGAAIQAALPVSADGDYTQIAGGITVGAADQALTDPTRANGVVLITDGKQNCQGTTSRGENGDEGPIDKPEDVVAELFGRTPSIRTWVVGFGGGVDAARLNTMAKNGGTARLVTTATSPRYYQADNSAELQKALREISLAAMGCSFVLGSTPDDLSQLFVAIDSWLVPRDTTHATGWDCATSTSDGGVSTSRLTLYGPACDALANTANATLKIVYGCSDGFNEGGNDGGFDFEIE
jgi:hypothetical protein